MLEGEKSGNVFSFTSNVEKSKKILQWSGQMDWAGETGRANEEIHTQNAFSGLSILLKIGPSGTWESQRLGMGPALERVSVS